MWLSLFALEVSGYRPAEVYFPPMPTTTKTVGCSVDEDALCYDRFGNMDTRDKGVRPKSILMTESQANLPTVRCTYFLAHAVLFVTIHNMELDLVFKSASQFGFWYIEILGSNHVSHSVARLSTVPNKEEAEIDKTHSN